LQLDGNNFNGNLPSTLGSIANLRYIYLHNNRFEGPIPETFVNLPTGQVEFRVENNNFNRASNHNVFFT